MSTAKKMEKRGTLQIVGGSPFLCCAEDIQADCQDGIAPEDEAETGITAKDCSCWKIQGCEVSQNCPDKCASGKTCWETSFLHNNWQKVFEKCRECKVFKQDLCRQR
jgi:hypothetical protein